MWKNTATIDVILKKKNYKAKILTSSIFKSRINKNNFEKKYKCKKKKKTEKSWKKSNFAKKKKKVEKKEEEMQCKLLLL